MNIKKQNNRSISSLNDFFKENADETWLSTDYHQKCYKISQAFYQIKGLFSILQTSHYFWGQWVTSKIKTTQVNTN